MGFRAAVLILLVALPACVWACGWFEVLSMRVTE